MNNFIIFQNLVCGGSGVLRIIKFIFKLLDILFFIIPMIAIALITFDFVKSVLSNNVDNMKKYSMLALKKVLFCMAIFLVEPITTAAINLLGDTEKNKGDFNWVDCTKIAKTEDLSKYDYNFDTSSSSSNISSNGTTNSSGTSIIGQGSSNTYSSKKTYKKRTVIKTLSAKDIKETITIPKSNNYGGAQAIAIVNDKVVVTRSTSSHNKILLISVLNLSDGKLFSKNTYKLEHGGGMTYNKTTNKIYVKTGNESKKIKILSADDVVAGKDTTIKTQDIGKYGSGFAYDSSTNTYYSNSFSNKKIYVFDSNLKYKKSFELVTKGSCGSKGANCQDMCAHNGLALIPFFKYSGQISNVKENGIDFYRLSDGAYLGSYKLPTKSSDGKLLEVESLDYQGPGNTYLLLMNVVGSSEEKIYTINIDL